jgi:endonuclease/exonuclease/phosphatase family metal-dependent hydrolase
MRIITYNTRGSLGLDQVRRTDRIIETVRPLSADILCFQEIHQRLLWSGREDQPDVLQRALNRSFAFQANVRFGSGGYGIGIATRYPIYERIEHALPGGKERRGALELRLRNADGWRRLTVFCTHWGLTIEERRQQAEALAERVQAAPRPVILCGDFNETIEGEALRWFLAETGLHDADAVGNRPTFVAGNPTQRIDLILFSEELKAQRSETLSSAASDHLPVVADLERA